MVSVIQKVENACVRMDLQDLDAMKSINVQEVTFSLPYATVSFIICSKFEFFSRNNILQDVIVINMEQPKKYAMRTVNVFARLILVGKDAKNAKMTTTSILNV